MSGTEHLVRLAETAGAAVIDALAELGVAAEQNGVTALEDGGSHFAGFEPPLVTTALDLADGGSVTLVLTAVGARRLAAAAAGDEQPDDDGAEPDLAEAGAVTARLVLAAAPAAEMEPETTLVTELGTADAFEAGATVALVICGEPAALVLVVPAGTPDDPLNGAIAGDSLREVRVRLWAELGRTRMALGRAVGLAPGEVVELDTAVDDPVDIFVNGVRLGTGHLVVGDDGEWAFRVAEVSAGPVLDRALAGKALHRDEHPADERKES